MVRRKKISEEQFLLDCINKEFEIIGSTLHWDTFEELVKWSKLPENKYWFSDYEFTTEEQYNEWKQYCISHFYDWSSKMYSKIYVENSFFPMLSLHYGFSEKWEK